MLELVDVLESSSEITDYLWDFGQYFSHPIVRKAKWHTVDNSA